MSVCVISDARDHDKNAVAAFSTKFLHFIKEEFSSVESVDIWTEGPSSQFKNKYIFVLLPALEKFHDIRLRWNYFATSQGKGPSDALGGLVKRIVHRQVMTRHDDVRDANTFAQSLERSKSTTAKVFVINQDQIDKAAEDLQLESLWDGLKSFPGTVNTHMMKSVSNGHIMLKFYSTAAEYIQCPIKYVAGAKSLKGSAESTADFDENTPHLNPTVLVNGKKSQPKQRKEKEKGSDTEKKSYQRKPRTPFKQNHNSGEWKCPRCQCLFGQAKDPHFHDDWLCCKGCRKWYHETCAEEKGIVEDGDIFKCFTCL